MSLPAANASRMSRSARRWLPRWLGAGNSVGMRDGSTYDSRRGGDERVSLVGQSREWLRAVVDCLWTDRR